MTDPIQVGTATDEEGLEVLVVVVEDGDVIEEAGPVHWSRFFTEQHPGEYLRCERCFPVSESEKRAMHGDK